MAQNCGWQKWAQHGLSTKNRYTWIFSIPTRFFFSQIFARPPKKPLRMKSQQWLPEIFAAAVYTNTTPASSIDSESCRVRDGDHQGTSGTLCWKEDDTLLDWFPYGIEQHIKTRYHFHLPDFPYLTMYSFIHKISGIRSNSVQLGDIESWKVVCKLFKLPCNPITTFYGTTKKIKDITTTNFFMGPLMP